MGGLVYQFKISLLETNPSIWRRIQVPDEYSFWDLHVAIQDAFGWLDYHLHAFLPNQPDSAKRLEIGIPDEDADKSVVPSWRVAIREFFRSPGDNMCYDYDFGDGWRHDVVFEGASVREPSVSCPRCVAGERLGPPEDCGGVSGLERLLEVLRHPKSSEYQEYREWLRDRHAKKYWPYVPEKFSPDQVKFDDPRERWEKAFKESHVQ